MIGEKLGSFRIEAILGTGAMGVVYRGISETTGKPAAVKVISGELAQKSKSYERFRREAEILKQFRHPNIVRFLAVGRYQGTSYFAMEYVAGETLEQMLRRQGPRPWREIVELAIQTCEALHYAHEHGVVHRDLKPSNLMVSEEGQIKLTDFGIAKDLDATALTATGRTLGTAAYMAPEQIRGTPEVSHKTDLYALGVVLYQMLTGRAPFEGSSAVVLMHCHMNEPPPRPSARVAEIPVALDKLVVQLMAKDPNDRPWDAAAVAVSLGEIRDKASRGDTVAMVWATEGDQELTPTRAGLLTRAAGTEIPAPKPRKAAKAKRRLALPELDRSFLEVALLCLGLVVVGAFIGYMFWPPSAPYLYRQAERLMASEKLSDWTTARDEYLNPLDTRFKQNPYLKTTQGWRDRIDLKIADNRAKILEAPTQTRFNEPQNATEGAYQAYYRLASKASSEGNDLAAVGYWEEMTTKVNPKVAEERGWYLLSQKRVTDLKQAILKRREVVAGLLSRALQAEQSGRSAEAANIREDLKTHFGKYTDLNELFLNFGLKEAPAATTPLPSAPAASNDVAPGDDGAAKIKDP
ncbi:serine/threonine protein kinase [Singulisphaera acidiphila]|uniref:non-specific serine/threonine protein kinase n=1 Tax=Singulisphaera acidiphila (strain ATCC BAA-1392 / DSM 18658 / VKM B-2454 / MOB10) TaxID=886293 RepID=L0DA77_SINAD|nr:serine/threonine-protein kinase [Singulisphaera acidiphila]AGA25738.1 protein kinase family protein [Singulisphaera acidiphila DSM 18658]